MASQKNLIKEAIVADLQKLVPGTLASVVQRDLNRDPFAADYDGFPVAIVGLASTKSDYETNRENLRTYIFPVLVIQRLENTSAPTDIEDLEEAVLNIIDNDPTLGGTANGAVQPAITPLEPVSTGDKSYVGFVVELQAKALVELTF